MIEAMGGLAEGAVVDGEAGFAASELFERTFKEGMALVEDAAVYLDGEGRQASKHLGRDAALVYASESMALTTRLMQVASWLLVQRAVRQGEMSSAEAAQPRYRIGEPARVSAPTEPAGFLNEPLPEGLGELTGRAERLFDRIAHLDRRLYLAPDAAEPNPVLSHFDRLQAAFG